MSNIVFLRDFRTMAKPMPVIMCSDLIACTLSIIQIVIRSLYLNKCPRQHYIPIYLIDVWFVHCAALLPPLHPEGRQQSPQQTLHHLEFTDLSLPVLLVNCCVWIYSIYQPNYTKNATSPHVYCNETLYLFAFWNTTLVYILLGLFFVLVCCVLPCYICGLAAAQAYLVQK